MSWSAEGGLADVTNVRSSVGVDKQVPGEVNLGTKELGTLVTLELGRVVDCAPVIGQPALGDKTFITSRAGESTVSSMQLHVVSEGFGPPGQCFVTNGALESPTFAMLLKMGS